MPAAQEMAAEDDNGADNIIIIHPGSLYVRIGRASDVNPVTVLHAVARKRKSEGAVYLDPLLPNTLHKVKDCTKEIEDARLLVSRLLQSQSLSSGRKRYVTPPQQIAAFNRRVTGTIISQSGGEWFECDEEFIVGDEILNLNPNSPYNVHFPIKRGEFNLHTNIAGSLTGVLEDMRTIWSYIIQFHLNIPLNQLKDHVAATFGAGVNYACVVDVGHEKTSISCVEDGISITSTRVKFAYGGADITQTFHWLLQKCAFPYSACNPYDNRLDSFLMQKLKHEFCHLNMDVCGCCEKSFIVRQPKKPVQKYTIQVGDECSIAVLSVFHPELLGLIVPKAVVTQHRIQSHPEDPLDAEYLRETTMRRGVKESLEGIVLENISEGHPVTQATADEEIVEGIETAPQVISSTEFVSECGVPVGLDTAIIRSIERYGPEELRQKFYSSILLVGGGLKFPGVNEFLEKKIFNILTNPQKLEQVEVLKSTKEIDIENCAWKGAAVMATLESAQELWIYTQEWQKHSVRLLREKAVFIW